jgi:predicted nucleotidyltransferase
MNEYREQLMSDLKEFFSKKEDVVFAYLFGSIAYNNYNSKSDIDVAVFLENKEDKDLFDERINLIVELEKKFKRDVDVVILNSVKDVFLRYVIFREGILLFRKDEEQRINFELRAMREYFDFAPYIKMYKEKLLLSK